MDEFISFKLMRKVRTLEISADLDIIVIDGCQCHGTEGDGFRTYKMSVNTWRQCIDIEALSKTLDPAMTTAVSCQVPQWPAQPSAL